MSKCKACLEKEAKPSSKKGYCGECQSKAIDGRHSKMAETNAERESQRKRVDGIIGEAEKAGETAAFQESEERYVISSVSIKPGTCDVAMRLRTSGYPLSRDRSRGGGVRLLAPSHLPIYKTWAWAAGYSKCLKSLGYNAEPHYIEMTGEKNANIQS